MPNESSQEEVIATPAELKQIWDDEAETRGEPAAKPVPVVKEEPVPTPVVPAAPVATEPDADPLAGLSPEVRAKLEAFDKMAERMRNLEGHIGGLNNGQKQIRELLTASKEVAKKVADAPTEAEIKAAAADPEKWAVLKEDFKEWSDGVEAYVNMRLAKFTPPTVDVADIDRRVEERVATVAPTLRRELAEDILDTTPEFSGWRDTVKTPEFKTWYDTQPDDVKVLASSDKYADAARLLRLAKAAAAPVAATNTIKETRQKTLEAATGSPKGKHVAPAKTVDDMSPEELWAYEAKKRDKARGL